MSDNEYDFILEPPIDFSIDNLFSSPKSSMDQLHPDSDLGSTDSDHLPSQTETPQDLTQPLSNPSPLMEVYDSSGSIRRDVYSQPLQPEVAMNWASQTDDQMTSFPPPSPPLYPSALMPLHTSDSTSTIHSSNYTPTINTNHIEAPGASSGGNMNPTKPTGNVPWHIMSRLIGLGIFNNVELQKLMCNKKLAQIACNDPRQAKKLLSNRMSAEKSQERKKQHLMELERKLHTLQLEITMRSEKLRSLKEETMQIPRENESLRIQISLKNDEVKTKKDLNEALKREVNQLKKLHLQQREMPKFSNKPDFFQLDEQQQQRILSSIVSLIQSQNAEHDTQSMADFVTSNDQQLPDI